MRIPQVTIPTLPIGNLAAVANMVRKCGGAPVFAADPHELLQAELIILSGVGAFDYGMRALEAGGWLEPLNQVVQYGTVPILGICLGMQLMCKNSEEGKLKGLGWFDADVRLIVPPPHSALKVPHMGWNTVSVVNPTPLFGMDTDEKRFYFVHSYHVVCHNPAEVIATTFYGHTVTAAIARGHLFGVQFHPEKSHRFGAELIGRFLGLQIHA